MKPIKDGLSRKYFFCARKLFWMCLTGVAFFTLHLHGQVGFNTVGFVTTATVTDLADCQWNSVASDQEGNIVVAGQPANTAAAVARYTPEGNLDSTFNSEGFTIQPNTAFQWNGVTIDAQNRIVAVGETASAPSYGIIARYTPTGGLDNSFGTEGSVTSTNDPNNTNATSWSAVILDSQGNIIVAGATNDNKGIVARYSSTGSLDTTFDTKGFVTEANANVWYGVTLDSQGTIWAAGFTPEINTSNYGIVASYNFLGSQQSRFTSMNDGTHAKQWFSIVIDPYGKIVVAGSTTTEGLIARYSSPGVLDTTFNNQGYIDNANALEWDSITFDTQGNILVGGVTRENGQIQQNWGIIARYTSTGILDTPFNGQGFIVSTANDTDGGWWKAIAVDAQSKIVGVGFTHLENDNYYAVVARYLINGKLDTPANWNSTVFAQQNAAIPLAIAFLA